MEIREIRKSRQQAAKEEARRFTQQAMAAELGVSVPKFRAIEDDPSSMTLSQATKIASLLGVPADDFSFLPKKGN